MPTPVANIEDVRAEYDTHLGDDEVETQILKASRRIHRYNNLDNWDEERVVEFEAVYAALRIATRIDRAESETGSRQFQSTYEKSVIEDLMMEVHRLDKSGKLLNKRPSAQSGSYRVY